MTLRKREDLEFGRGIRGSDCSGNSLWKGPWNSQNRLRNEVYEYVCVCGVGGAGIFWIQYP